MNNWKRLEDQRSDFIKLKQCVSQIDKWRATSKSCFVFRNGNNHTRKIQLKSFIYDKDSNTGVKN